MKKIAIIALAALSLAACKKEAAAPAVSNAEKAVVKLTLKSGTKADPEAQTADEKKVSSIQIFVFNEANQVDGYKAATAAEVAALEVEVAATVGVRDIYAFVNAPDLSSYTSKTALLAAEHEFTANSALDKFVMSGKIAAANVVADYENTINVDRYAARVKIDKVTRNFSNEALAALDFKIVRFFLTNVNDKVKYDFSAPTAYKWLNARFANSGAISTSNPFIVNKLETPAAVANEAAYETSHSLYAYPNANTGVVKESDAVVADQTILVVETKIGDDFYTYPVPVPNVLSNKSYEVKNLTLTRLGNPSNGDDVVDEGEDTPIQSSTATFTIVVNDWTVELLGTDGEYTI